MNKLLATIITSLFISNVFGQINMEDSTAQAIGYWNIGEHESYNISLQKIKLNLSDTISNEIMTYEVDITVVDSTAHSYLIEWFYHDFSTNSKDESVQKTTSLSENIKVLIETDEFGAITGVKNWKEVRDYISQSMDKLKDEVRDIPNMDKVFNQIEEMYSSKNGIESIAIQDAQQFYTYHGGKYLLGEVLEFTMQVENLFNPKKPFDSKTTLLLDELNPNDYNFIIRSTQEVDSKQLTNSVYDYLKMLSKTLKTEKPRKKHLGKLTNLTTTASRIHESGWLIYSIQTEEVTTMGLTNIEERIIEIK